MDDKHSWLLKVKLGGPDASEANPVAICGHPLDPQKKVSSAIKKLV